MSIMDRVDRLTRLAGRNRMELLLFRLSGNQMFGINVFKVREVLRCPALRPIPHSHHNMRGVFHARGQTIPVIDLAAVLGHGASEGNAQEFVIVTEYSGHVQGYLVHQVIRIVNLRWDDIKPPPPGIGNANYLTAVTTLENQLVEILDVERVLSEIVDLPMDVSEDLLGQPAEERSLPRHVFIADDSSVARKQVMRVMDQLGITYELAENGRIALERLMQYAEEGPLTRRFAMLLSDIEMPEMDGYTLTKTLKSDPLTKDLYICLHTSLSGSFNDSMASSVGADKLVAKFDPDDLAEIVIGVLRDGGVAPSAESD